MTDDELIAWVTERVNAQRRARGESEVTEQQVRDTTDLIMALGNSLQETRHG